ncbi:unnamed protein product [Choristocarpus tenellus]
MSGSVHRGKEIGLCFSLEYVSDTALEGTSTAFRYTSFCQQLKPYLSRWTSNGRVYRVSWWPTQNTQTLFPFCSCVPFFLGGGRLFCGRYVWTSGEALCYRLP